MSDTIIVSDLDGTLLDARNYSFERALPALISIRQLGIPLILCSSKTRAEIEVLRHRMQNHHPFISENGGGIFIPQHYFKTPVAAQSVNGYQLLRFGTPYSEIRQHFVRLRALLHARVRGFADMSVAEVAALTGLSEDEAALARQRDFDEAFVFDGEVEESFLRAIEGEGLHWTQGRIFHLMGQHDKGRALDMLLALYRQQSAGIHSIALGDSLNDLPMLRAADTPVLVRHDDGSCDARIDIPRMLQTRLPGPAGWNESVLALLAQQNRLAIFRAALVAADPYHALLQAARVENNFLLLADQAYDLAGCGRIVVVGAGKATARMAQALETLLGARISAGLIVVKHGHTAPLAVIEQVEAAHPLPDQAGIAGAQRVLQLVREADANTLVICLLSGGASALLIAPAEGITLQDKQEATRLLLNAGATINELNALRKHLSEVKGGRLAQAAYPAQLLTLILSDVIGDPLDVIASGPTAPDASTYADACAVIAKFGLGQAMPPRVMAHLQQGCAGQLAETVKAGDPCLDNTRNVIIAGLRQALGAAQYKAQQLGFATRMISATLQGEARVAARFLAHAARDELAAMHGGERRCLLYGGETTVTVRGNGIGGRNQELALAFALEIEGLAGVSLLSAGTDGSDGPNDAAGALVDGDTAADARNLGLDPLRFLDNNDSYHFFQQYDAAAGLHCHLKTGPTGTNVTDIQIVILSKEKDF